MTMTRHRSRGVLLRLMLGTMAAMIFLPAFAQQNADSTATKKLPENVQADVEAITANLLQIQRSDVELDCPKAVENARWGIETMLEVGERNMQGGYLSRSDYERMSAPFREELGKLSVQECEAATGGRQAFYRCMSSDYNHVMACAKLDVEG